MQLKQENFSNVSWKLNLNSRGSFLKGLANKINSIVANSIHDTKVNYLWLFASHKIFLAMNPSESVSFGIRWRALLSSNLKMFWVLLWTSFPLNQHGASIVPLLVWARWHRVQFSSNNGYWMWSIGKGMGLGCRGIEAKPERNDQVELWIVWQNKGSLPKRYLRRCPRRWKAGCLWGSFCKMFILKIRLQFTVNTD